MKRPCVFKCRYPDHLLDRVLVINGSHEHRVSGFKLALHSELFRNLLKQIRTRELERHNREETKQEIESQKSSSIAGSSGKPRRKRSRSISDVETEKVPLSYEDVHSLERVLSCVHCYEPPEKMDTDTSLSMENFEELTEDELEGFLSTALHFKMDAIVEYGRSSFLKLITCENCWRLWNISVRFSTQVPELADDATQFIRENFKECVASPDFNQLSAKDLTHFLCQEHLNVSSEMFLVNLVTKWVQYAPSSRNKDFISLIQCIKVKLLTAEEILEFQANPLVQKHWSFCNQLLVNPLQQNGDESSARNHQEVHLSDQLLRYLHTPRLPSEAVFVIGGWEGNQSDPNFGPSQAIQVYDARANCWNRFTDPSMALDFGHAYSSCVFYRGKVYVIGGYTHNAATQMLKEFDLETRTWRLMAPMHEKRNYVASCLLNDEIYAIGGHNGRVRLATVEKYDVASNYWRFVARMVQVRSDAGAATLNGKIYVCGGFDGQRFYCTAEVYSPVPNQWTAIAPMSEFRSGVAIIAHDDYIYAIGGNNGATRLRTVERYNPESNVWYQMASMQQQRSNFCVACLENEIYVIGGWNDETGSTIGNVEKWNPSTERATNAWKTVMSLPLSASANCCCTVKGFEFIEPFIHRE